MTSIKLEPCTRSTTSLLCVPGCTIFRGSADKKRKAQQAFCRLDVGYEKCASRWTPVPRMPFTTQYIALNCRSTQGMSVYGGIDCFESKIPLLALMKVKYGPQGIVSKTRFTTRQCCRASLPKECRVILHLSMSGLIALHCLCTIPGLKIVVIAQQFLYISTKSFVHTVLRRINHFELCKGYLVHRSTLQQHDRSAATQ